MQIRTTGLAAMADAASPAVDTPLSTNGRIFSGDRFHNVRSRPARCIALARADPINPTPIAVISLTTPPFMLFAAAMKVQLDQEWSALPTWMFRSSKNANRTPQRRCRADQSLEHVSYQG
jgi:hypothetical protein